MITLYAFGLPDPSPFVTKAEILLKMAGLPYRTDANGFSRAPKGKLPYVEDDGERIADSTFIRFYIEKKYGFDFDRGLNPEQRSVSWAFEKMMEEHLYFALLDSRWMDDANFAKGPMSFFRGVPAPLRPIVVAVIRRKVRQALRGQGMGRHTNAEVAQLGSRCIDAVATYLGRNSYFMGAEPSAVDATMFGFLAGALCPVFDTPLRTAAERHDNLRRYVGRMTGRYYPELPEVAGCKADDGRPATEIRSNGS